MGCRVDGKPIITHEVCDIFTRACLPCEAPTKGTAAHTTALPLWAVVKKAMPSPATDQHRSRTICRCIGIPPIFNV